MQDTNQPRPDTLNILLANQFAAALCTLGECIVRCPAGAWHSTVVNLKVCQVAFHTLFFADYYLGPKEDVFRCQPFHRDHPDFFRDYEELQPRRQQRLYDRHAILEYLAHCRHKAENVIAAETWEVLSGPSGFPGREFTRGELHLYNIRHIQHHAAQLSLHLRIHADQEIPWFGSGWPAGK